MKKKLKILLQKKKEEVKDEAEEYSANVKKRIDKLTFKLREAERQKEEALKFAEAQKKRGYFSKIKSTKSR